MKAKKLILTNLPYVLIGLACTNLGEAWRMAEGRRRHGEAPGAYWYDTHCVWQPIAELQRPRPLRRSHLRVAAAACRVSSSARTRRSTGTTSSTARPAGDS